METFGGPTNYTAGSSPTFVTAADLNNDGTPDLIAVGRGTQNFAVLLGNGDGTFQLALTSHIQREPNAVAVGDFNGDGNLDVAISSAVVVVMLGNGDGTFQPPVNYRTSGPESLTTADLNGDGKLDLAAVSLFAGHGQHSARQRRRYISEPQGLQGG